MASKDSYISFLEEAVAKHPNAPADKIVDWNGKGKLPTTTDAGIDKLIAKITKGDKPTDKGIQEAAKKDADDSPLSILENELNEAEEEAPIEEPAEGKETKETPEKEEKIEESIKFTDQESDILSRLIKEMNALDDIEGQDDLLDEEIGEEVMEPDEPIEPVEDYELDDLDVE